MQLMTPDTAPSTDLATTLKIAYLEDGTPYEVETGEILDPQNPDVQLAMDANPPPQAIADRFEVQDEDGAEWVLERLSEIDATLAALEARKAAVVRQMEAIIKEARRRRDWWHVRFAGSLIDFARSTLGKTQTRRFTHGTISFRKAKGRREILLPDEAAAFVERWRPSLIRRAVLPVRLSDIDAAIETAVLETEDEGYRRPAFLLIEGEKTNTKIDTGIKLETSK